MTLRVAEIFKSVQGESTLAGRPCVFIRLTGCNLDCGYCDTRYARRGGREMGLDAVLSKVRRLRGRLAEVTGGEPLLQAATVPLMRKLLAARYTVMLETNGSLPLNRVPKGVIKIVDVKTPGSGQGNRFLPANLRFLNPGDEVKFVLTGEADYRFARRFVARHRLAQKCACLFSPALPGLNPARLAEWIVRDNLPVRLNLQLHKILWPAKKRGV